MLKEEKDIIADGAIRVYRTQADRLRFVRSYSYKGYITSYTNRANPLLYIYTISMAILLPFICISTNFKLQDGLVELYNVLIKGKTM